MAKGTHHALWRRVAVGLGRQPAYLLVFGIVALFFLTGTVTSGVIVARGDALYGGAFAIFCLFLALGATLYVVNRLEPRVPEPAPKGSTSQTDEISSLGSTELALLDTPLKDCFQAVFDHLRSAMVFANPVFREAILSECEDLRRRSADWGNGQLVVTNYTYNQVLLAMYDSARSNVFSTSVPEYRPAWQSNLGQQILEAHSRSKAKVTRVFVFNVRADVTKQDYDEMAEQSHREIEVLLYFDREEETFQFSPDLSKDFTIIDNGDAIAVTQSVNGESLQARWYLNDSNRSPTYRQYARSLTNASLTFSRFEEWWRTEKGQ